MAESVLDTSVLVAFLAGETIRSVENTLSDGTALIPALVVAELVTGATTLQDRENVGGLLQDADVFGANLGHWIQVGLLRQHLRRHGLTITLPDAHIAQCAIERDAALITRDAVFAKIARHSKLRVVSA